MLTLTTVGRTFAFLNCNIEVFLQIKFRISSTLKTSQKSLLQMEKLHIREISEEILEESSIHVRCPEGRNYFSKEFTDMIIESQR